MVAGCDMAQGNLSREQPPRRSRRGSQCEEEEQQQLSGTVKNAVDIFEKLVQ